MDDKQKFSFDTPETILTISEVIISGENPDSDLRAHIEKSDKKMKEISSLSTQKKTRLEEEINKSAAYDKDGYHIMFSDVAKAVETILSEPDSLFLPALYRNTDPSQEFAVSRWVADKVYHLPTLLGTTNLEPLNPGNYLVSAEQKDSKGNSIKLEHRFKATSDEEAKKVYKEISSQLAGPQQKIWLACWRLGNELGRHTYQCHLTDLMKIAHPDREACFSSDEKLDFFEHLKSLERTKFVFSKPQKKKKNGETVYQKFEIPLLQIPGRIEEEKATSPDQLTIVLMNLVPNPGKMAFVGTRIKNRTLELHADDTQLATWIQMRKSQVPTQKHLSVDLGFLFQLAGLERTAESNKSQARKSLRNKLQRLVDKGILVKVPEKLDETVQIPIR